MKFLTPTALLAAALLSVVIALPFVPAAKMGPDRFVIEARVTSATNASLQLFYDDGGGFREELTARVALAATSEPAAVLLPIPAGTYRALRLDPPENGGRLTLHSLRVFTRGGRLLADLPLAGFKPVQQLKTLAHESERLVLESAPGSDDPQIHLELPRPLAVQPGWVDYAREVPLRALPVFAAFAVLLFLADRLPRGRDAIARAARRLAASPGRAILAAAALGVVTSSYPIVFLGKSLVSPNLGTTLLYDAFPSVPGDQTTETTDVKLSDVGAIMWQHVPFSMMQHRALREGELPLWNRYNALGVPLLAQGQSMFGDPVHLLVVLADGAAWAWDLKYLLAKWLFAAGLGLTVLALLKDPATKGPKDEKTTADTSSPLVPWSLGPVVPAALVAVVAPFIGFFLYRVNHPAYFSLCYAPWPLYCLVRLACAPVASRRALTGWSLGLVVANLALMNSGTVKEAYMLLLCVNFSGACVVAARAESWRERAAKFGALLWFGLLFALITMPIWATFLGTLKQSYTGYNAVSAYQIQPTLLLGAFDEIFYRPLMTKDQVFSPSLNFLLLLGLLYWLATLRLHFPHRAAIALAASSLVPLALAFGLVPPAWIVTLPFLGNIAHLDNTFSCALIVLWSVLAGLGFATAARRLGTAAGRHDLVVAGLLLGALVFGWIAFRQAAHRPIHGPIFSVHPPGQVLAITPFLWDYLAALLLAAGVLAVTLHTTGARRAWTAARGLLAAGCVLVLIWRHGLHASAVGFEDFTCRPTPRAGFHGRSEAMRLAREGHAREPGRGFGLHSNFFPGWTGVYGLEGIHGPDALVNPFVRELLGASGIERLWDWRFYAEAKDVGHVRPFFDALNVRHYFDLASDQGALGRALRLVRTADLDVYESPTAWPRAFFTNRVEGYEHPADLVAKIRASPGRPFAAVQNPDGAAQSAVSRLARGAGGTIIPATHYRLTANATSFVVRADGPGLIALTEAHWPGDFRADLNGRDLPVVRVNHAFQGVVVEAAGEYRVTFRYWPHHFTRHLTLAALGLLLLAASGLLAWRAPPSPA